MFQRFYGKYSKCNEWVRDNVFDFDFLLGLRALACFAVIFLHMYYSFFNQPKELVKLNYNWLFPLLADGSLAVLLFFTLSGYLMFKIFDLGNYQTNFKGLTKFYLGRIKRIVPLYLFVFFVGVLFVDTTLLEPKNWTKFWELLTFRQYLYEYKDYVYEKHQWFTIAWSLVVEMQYYIIAPFVAYLLIKFRNIWFNIIAFGIVNYFIYTRYWEELLINNTNFNVSKCLIFYICFFVSGALLVNILRNEFIKKYLSQLYLILPIIVIAIFYLPIYTGQNIDNPNIIKLSKDLTFVVHCLVLSAIAIYESHYYYRKPAKLNADNYQFSFSSWKTTLEFFGHLSFGMYLWHLLVIFRLNNIFTIEDRKYFKISELNYALIAMVLIFTLTTIIALFTYLNVELKWLKKPKKLNQ
jgi:peptidoglycan/LPS O-acetylase OafA/YrhL